MKTVEDLADLATDEIRGGYEVRGGERVKVPGVLETFNLSQEDAEMLILQARVAAGWIDASELPQPEYVEEETLEGDVEFDGEGQEDAQADEADADADAELVADDLDDQSRDM